MFTLVAIAQFMVVLDTAIINVALPVMKSDLGFGDSSLQWVVTAYVLTFGGFLLLGGRAADLFGRRRMLVAGMLAFTVFSLLIGLNSSPTVLIVLRALQGFSAGLMSPAALSIVLVTFTEARERGRALGYWSMVSTGGAAVGLLLGGVLTQYAGWRWNFFINVPIGLVVAALIARVVPVHGHDDRPRRLDLPGAVLVTAGLMAAVLGFSQAPAWGWTNPGTLAILAAAVLLLAVFTWYESRQSQPLMDLAIVRRRNVSGANVMMAAIYGGNLGMFFVLTLWMQGVQHWDAVQTGLAFLPFPVVLGGVSTRMGGLVHRFGFRPFLIAGPTLVASGMAWLCFLPVHGSYAGTVLPALLVMAAGYGMSFAPMYAAATGSLPARLSGLASGLITTSQQMGGALGLAVLSGVAASVTASATRQGRTQALVTGYNAGMLVAVALTVIALAVAVTVIRRPAPATVDEAGSGADRPFAHTTRP
ncbi:MFS transporter [Actinocatenispora rupis]|uniref:MFS transporter n=1 Tax=Actinocatenispora rupis TaxID=519421 RepID=A0A8J3J4V1_9ACTN|nr:MFS transporter [Actinocatenispora rupis]GID10194.1 MFS transporter [Actinocatenispora rupis]